MALRRLVRNGIRTQTVPIPAPAQDGLIGTYCQDTVWPTGTPTVPDAAALVNFGQCVTESLLSTGMKSQEQRREKLRKALQSAYPNSSNNP
jgi:hypothetical protein